MEDWTDVMYVSMYGCNLYHYGNDEDIGKCENSEAFGMSAAICTSHRSLSVSSNDLVQQNLCLTLQNAHIT